MSIRKRKFKRGVRWFVDVALPNGQRFRKIVGTKKQAERVHKKIEAEIVAGKWDIGETEKVLFSDFVSEYLEYVVTSKAASTATIRKYRIEAHLLPYLGDISLKEITSQLVDKYKARRIKQGASPNTINRELANLSHMLKMAVRWRYIGKNVVSGVDRMKISERNPRFLSQEEIQKLIDAAEGSYIHPLIVTAVHTGMRKSELLNLKWSDIDFAQQIVMVQPKPDWHTKNYKPRTLKMTPVLCGILKKHRESQAEFGVQGEYVFTYRGVRIKNGVDTSLRKVVKAAGLGNVTLHTLRHTFASQLVMAGVPLRDVQELMGHKSFETTLQYAHLSEEHVKSQVLRLPFAND